MKQRYNDYSHKLALRATLTLMQGKTSRGEILGFIEKHAGIPRSEIYESQLTGDKAVQLEAAEAIALFLDQTIEDLLQGIEPEEMEPVTTEARKDGITGKIRDISTLCVPHQLLGHLVKCGLEPLLKARLLPQQHASIPRHGQTKVCRQTKHYLNMKSLGITVAQKTDMISAYKSIKYKTLLGILKQEIPSAKWILATMEYLGRLAPDGALIIGGYLDAWLFNLAMSYPMRYVLSLHSVRRGKMIPYVKRIEAQMDDFVFLGSSATGLRKAIRELEKWVSTYYGAHIRITTGVIRLLAVEEERQRKKRANPAARGCPNIDVAGFRICRTHVRIRRSNWKRTRRQLLRAWAEYQRKGSICLQRANNLIARNGPIRATYSNRLIQKYHVEELMAVAKRVKSFYARRETAIRQVRIVRYILVDPEKRYMNLQRR